MKFFSTCVTHQEKAWSINFCVPFGYNFLSFQIFFLQKAPIRDTLVTVDPGSRPDKKYARRRERQKYVGRIKYNLGLPAKEFLFVQ